MCQSSCCDDLDVHDITNESDRKIKLSRRVKKQMKKVDAAFWEIKHTKNLRYEYHQNWVQLHFLKGSNS